MTQTHGHFTKFAQALADLSAPMPHLPPEMEALCHLGAEAIRVGQRFYLPEAHAVLDHRLIDASVKALIRLPFDVTVILSETHFGELQDGDRLMPTTRDFESWKITIAFDMSSDFNARYRLLIDDPLPGFGVLTTFISPGLGRWVMLPAVSHCHLPADREGFFIKPYALSDEAAKLDVARDMTDDVSSALNLCTMLALHNVAARDRQPPGKLNKKRLSRGRLPLLSYKVLTVDGEDWDSLGGDGTTITGGVRSHLRRGHIRRLAVDRLVWVRATFVRGSVPGFVAKDYDVKTGGIAAVPQQHTPGADASS